MRVGVYARYSSDLQDARSIEDQVAAARDHAAREGWEVVEVYLDAAISGASVANRPGLKALMAAAKNKAFDAVLTESMDRLSRDLEDAAGIHKRLAFVGVPIVTLADGEMDKTRVAIKGLVGSIFLDDLRQKVKRGLKGRLNEGKIPSGRCFGYDPIPGRPGERSINEEQAAIIRRIFREYADGRGPLAIVGDLNREGVPGPRGGQWNSSTLVGSRKRANGVLQNSLYVGKLQYERQAFVKDPETGRRQARPNAQSAWLTKDVPQLRILEDELWQAVQQRRALRGGESASFQRRPKRVLSGLLECGCCGGPYIITQGEYVSCAKHTNKRTCDNSRHMKMSAIEARVLEALRKHLLSPERVEMAVERYRREREALAKANAKDRHAIERELGQVRRAYDRVMQAIMYGDTDVRELGPQQAELAKRRRELEGLLAAAEQKVVAIHPNAAKSYRAKVEEIQAALMQGDAAGENAVRLVRGLIERIVITPMDDRMDLQVFGDLAVLLGNASSPKAELGNVGVGCGGPI
jgi:site-specific DNA recombinase